MIPYEIALLKTSRMLKNSMPIISNKEYSPLKSIIIPLIFNFFGFCYIILKIYEAKDKSSNEPDENLSYSPKSKGEIIQESSVKSIDDLNLDPQTRKKLEESMVTVDMNKEKDLNSVISEEIGPVVFLILDGITDPRNYGACLRSAASFGVTGVIIPKDNSAPLNEAAFKASSGTAFLIPIYEVVNLSRCITNFKKKNVWVFGTDSQASKRIDQEELPGKLALVMGSEGKGIRENVKSHCDLMLRVPVKNSEFTLNVSVATGICLNEIYRQQLITT